MRARASLTAELVCVLRALGGDDPYAARLLSPPMRALMAAWRTAERAGLPTDWATLGIGPAVRSRHAFLDDVLSGALEAGARQVAILGAGLDARPWRFAERLGDRRLFVVDHPATAAARAEAARALPAASGQAVTVDFARETVGPALLAAGFDPAAPTCFVWEGVSMYLSEAQVADFLRQLRGLCPAAPGTALAMDFWSPAPPGSPYRAAEAATRAALSAVGEPLGFTLRRTEVGPFLAKVGWSLERLRTAAEVARERGDGRVRTGLLLVAAHPVG